MGNARRIGANHSRGDYWRKALFLICGVLAAGGIVMRPHALAQEPPPTEIAAPPTRTLCRGTSADEDASLESRCDAVCRSTDGDCSDELYSLIRNGDARVNVAGGAYPMRQQYIVSNAQNVTIAGDGNTLFDFDNASLQFINGRNIELYNFSQRGTSDGGEGYFRFRGTQDLLIHNITFDSPEGNSRMFFISNGTRVTIRDSYFKAESKGLCLIDASGRDWLIENNHWENGNSACLNAFGSLCGARFRNNRYVGSGTTPPYAAISLEEYADFCDAGVAYDNITVERNVFEGVNGILSVDREKGFRYDNIRIDTNEFNDRTAVSLNDEVHGLAILNNTIKTDALWHAINLAPRTAEDGVMTDVTITGNSIYHAAQNQVTLNVSRIVNATINGNSISSQGDCTLLSRTNGATITGNSMSCGSRAFRLAGNDTISEYCNDTMSPVKYSAAGNTNFYLETWLYNALPTGCSQGGLMDGRTIILNNLGEPGRLTCIDGRWQAYDPNRPRCPAAAELPSKR